MGQCYDTVPNGSMLWHSTYWVIVRTQYGLGHLCHSTYWVSVKTVPTGSVLGHSTYWVSVMSQYLLGQCYVTVPTGSVLRHSTYWVSSKTQNLLVSVWMQCLPESVLRQYLLGLAHHFTVAGWSFVYTFFPNVDHKICVRCRVFDCHSKNVYE